jgi:hypothetical protein
VADLDVPRPCQEDEIPHLVRRLERVSQAESEDQFERVT